MSKTRVSIFNILVKLNKMAALAMSMAYMAAMQKMMAPILKKIKIPYQDQVILDSIVDMKITIMIQRNFSIDLDFFIIRVELIRIVEPY